MDSPLDEGEAAVSLIKKGATLLKCARQGDPHFRFFCLSEDNERLTWSSPKKKSEESSVRIREVTELRLGQKTPVFQKRRVPQYEHLSFSLLYGQRTLDIVCKDKKEFETWVKALKVLVSTNKIDSPRLNGLSVGHANSLPSETTQGLRQSLGLETDEECLQVSFRGNTTVVVSRENKCDIYTWGQGENGRLGHDDECDQLIPKVVESLLGKDIRAIFCGPSHSAVVSMNGQLWTWGSGGSGKLGHGHMRDRFSPTWVKAFQDLENETRLAPINRCGSAPSYSLQALRNSSPSSLANASSLAVGSPAGVSPANYRGARALWVGCGESHTAVLVDAAKVYVWGNASQGRLGLGTELDVPLPKLLPLRSKRVVFVTCGYFHTALITDQEEVFTWGGNDKGQLGLGDLVSRKEPQEITWFSHLHVSHIVCAMWHSAAINRSGQVYTWGEGGQGQLGHGDKAIQLKPKRVEYFSGTSPNLKVKRIDCGDFHTVTISEGGKVYSWGQGEYGQLGHGPSITSSDCPQPIGSPLETGVVDIACGSYHVLALTDKGQVFTWGYGANGRLGHGDEEWQFFPRIVEAMIGKHVCTIAAGGSHSAATILHGWVPDSESPLCMACKTLFTFVKRRVSFFPCLFGLLTRSRLHLDTVC
eukprot:TRINITY_DN2750_c0_g1_i2.p1 TRINITY_DN2750_c0_g1~~TRINITY_DN2750_c0_g1_i2.p1  ORF type:complete len:645 (+),score=95.05 TRINITY_DN2750_c0_g1_i2:12-1946(+)